MQALFFIGMVSFFSMLRSMNVEIVTNDNISFLVSNDLIKSSELLSKISCQKLHSISVLNAAQFSALLPYWQMALVDKKKLKKILKSESNIQRMQLYNSAYNLKIPLLISLLDKIVIKKFNTVHEFQEAQKDPELYERQQIGVDNKKISQEIAAKLLLKNKYKLHPKIETLRNHNESISCIDFNNDGTLLASCSWDKTVRLWRSNLKLVTILDRYSEIFNKVKFNYGSTLLINSANKEIKIWDVATHKLTFYTMGYNKSTVSLAAHPQKNEFATGGVMVPDSGSLPDAYFTVKLWDARVEKPVHELQVSILPDNLIYNPAGTQLAIANAHDPIQIWDLCMNKRSKILTKGPSRRERDSAIAMQFSQGGQNLISSYHDIQIWDLKNNSRTTCYSPVDDDLHSITLIPDTHLAIAGGGEGTLSIWNLKKYKLCSFFKESLYGEILYNKQQDIFAVKDNCNIKLLDFNRNSKKTVSKVLIKIAKNRTNV